MKAELLPLEGKYYGTNVKITDDDGFEFIITIWNPGNFEPSDRELGGICTIEQWRNNEIIPETNPWTGEKGIPAQEAVPICDSHFESRVTYNMAMQLINLINGDNDVQT